jgi:sec-independent protein translocase protein TatA
MISGNEWIIVILVVALIFGASRLPLLGRNLGQGIKEFKKGINDARGDKRGKDRRTDPPGPGPDRRIDPPGQDGQPDDRIGDRRD